LDFLSLLASCISSSLFFSPHPIFLPLCQKVHALVFDPAVGKLERLHVNFKGILAENADV